MIALYIDLAVGALAFTIILWPNRKRNPFAPASITSAGPPPFARPDGSPAGPGVIDGAASTSTATALSTVGPRGELGTAPHAAPGDSPAPLTMTGAELYADHCGNTRWLEAS